MTNQLICTIDIPPGYLLLSWSMLNVDENENDCCHTVYPKLMSKRLSRKKQEGRKRKYKKSYLFTKEVCLRILVKPHDYHTILINQSDSYLVCLFLIKISEVRAFDKQFDTLKMPLSFDEATKRYYGYIQNIQDSIYTIESYMGAKQRFSYNVPQVLGNFDQVDLTKEEKTISLQIQVLEE